MAKKSNHPGRISQEKIEKMCLDWMEGMTLTNLKNKYDISIKTIVKYRDDGKWLARKAKIQSVVAKRLDKTTATRKARRARMGVKLQAEGLKNLGRGIENESVALNAIKLGTELEDQAYGNDDATMTIQIKLPKGTQVGYIGNDK